MTTMPIAMLMITTTKTTTMTTKMLMKPMTTMMLRKHTMTAMFRCASHAGTLATVRIEIVDVQTTNALIAANKDTSGGFARMCSVRIAIFLVT
jgi:hypothetical protein